ncbi:MAG TPA: choice-of-anchor tandem repeat GloVer-containing protein [Dongiaceae bacterium]|nr:choice-of-anchor tandem repeat GloVer-containing protein [Dongiaceae bacterium]
MTPLLVAADITPLHFFDTFTEGDTPYCELLITNGWIYGTTSAHGTNGNNSAGTVFKLSTTGTSLTVLKTFSNTGSNATPHDLGGLTLGGDILYGTTAYGVGNGGTVFKINTDGTGFETLYAFNTSGQSFPDGILPEAGLLLLGDTLYGTTYNGGLGGNGTLFKIGTNGTGYAQLKQFTNNYPANGSVPGVLAGTHPGGALATDGTYIFGTTHQGGTNFYGVIYRIGTDGNGFAVLRSFDGLELGGSPDYGVICDGSTLYGVAGGGTLLPGIGSGRGGVVFKMNTDGSGYAVLHSFTNKPDGKTPTGKLLLLGHTLYGVTSAGGTNGTGFGTVYQVNTDGSGYAILHHFTNSVPGLRTPVNVGLSAAGGQLFGVARFGGPNDGGGIFTLAQPATESAAPLLHIAPLSGAVLLTWPTNASGFLLETNATLDLPNTWSVLTSNYGVIDTNYAVTSSIDRPVQLFRLYQP